MHGNALDLMTKNGSAKDNQWLQTAFTFLRLMIIHGDGSKDHETKVESVVRGIMEIVADMTEGAQYQLSHALPSTDELRI
jgi:hypothetical protein